MFKQISMLFPFFDGNSLTLMFQFIQQAKGSEGKPEKRLLQFTRQMDMLMRSEASVEAVAKGFLEGNYRLDQEFFDNLCKNGTAPGRES